MPLSRYFFGSSNVPVAIVVLLHMGTIYDVRITLSTGIQVGVDAGGNREGLVPAFRGLFKQVDGVRPDINDLRGIIAADGDCRRAAGGV